MKFSFRGGTHLDEHKNTAACPIEVMTSPTRVSVPLIQHIGQPCEPLVAVGDRVLRGQKLGDVASGLGCPVHSSVSGKVVSIDSRNNALGVPIRNVIIENDGLDEPDPAMLGEPTDYTSLTPEETVGLIRDAGVSGMGGATFPTYAKLSSAIGKVDRLIINCAECEPYITADHRMMLEHPDKVIGGIRILMRALNLAHGDIAIEDNKPDAIARLRESLGTSDDIRIFVCRTKYPQGDERQLIYALTGKELPSGKYPADIGCVLFNCSTCAAVYDAVVLHKPLIERVVTVDGDCVKQPKNLLVRIGTPFSEVIAQCGGLTRLPKKLVCGGPMMGAAQWDVESPVTKGTSALLVFSADVDAAPYDLPPICIRCGSCVRHCPMHLMPNYLVQYAIAGDYDACERLGVMSCVECGTCSEGCPGKMMIVQYIRVAKGALRARK